MATAVPPSDSTDTWPTLVTRLRQRVSQAGWLLRGTWIACGLGLFVGVPLTVLLVAAALDLIVALWDVGRWTAFLASTGFVALIAWYRLVIPATVRLAMPQVALRIENRLPGIHNRLVTALDLAARPLDAESRSFLAVIVRQAYDRVQGFRTTTLVDTISLRRAMLWMVIPILVLVAAFLVEPRATEVTLRRVLLPWEPIAPFAPYTFVIEPGNQSILRGEKADIRVTLVGGSARRVELAYSTAEGEPQRKLMQPCGDNQWSLEFPDFRQTINYRIETERTWSDQFTLRLIERPTIDELTITIRPPAYVPQLAPVNHPVSQKLIRTLIGSSVEFSIKASGNVQAAWLQNYFDRSARQRWESQADTDRVWFLDELPPNSGAEGEWRWDWREKHVRTRANLPKPGADRHAFTDWRGFSLGPDEALWVWARIDPKNQPTRVALEVNQGGNWDRKFYWGEASSDGDPAKQTRLGDVPTADAWVRLTIPGEKHKLTGNRLRGLGFVVHGGSVRWGAVGASRGLWINDEPRKPAEKIEFTKMGPDQWVGVLTVSGNKETEVRLSNDSGYENLNPPTYVIQSITDNPPTLRIVTPNRDLLLSKLTSQMPLVLDLADDVALSQVSVVIGREQDSTRRESTLATFPEIRKSIRLNVNLPLAEFMPRMGDVFLFQVRLSDRAGNSVVSKPYRVEFRDDWNALDKQRERFQEQRNKLAERVDQLTQAHREVAAQLARLANPENPRPLTLESQSAPRTESPEPNASAPMETKSEPESAQSPTSARDAKSTLTEQSDSAQPTTANNRTGNAIDQAPPQPNKQTPPTVDPTTLKPSERRDLVNKLADKQQQQAAEAETLARELNGLVEQNQANQALPSAEQAALASAAADLKSIAKNQLPTTVQKTREAAKENASAAQRPTSDTNEAADQAVSTQRALERVNDRLQGLERPQQSPADDANAIAARMAQLQAREAADIARDMLETLADKLAELRSNVDGLQDRQTALAAKAKEEVTNQLDPLAGQQRRLENDATPVLREVADILGQTTPDPLAGLDKNPPSAAAPGDDQKDAAPSNENGDASADPAASPDQAETAEPSLTGPNTLFETLAKRGRERDKKGGEAKLPTNENAKRERLASDQQRLGRDLDKAETILSGQSGELSALRRELADPRLNQPGQLAQKIEQSAALRQALAQAARLQPGQAANSTRSSLANELTLGESLQSGQQTMPGLLSQNVDLSPEQLAAIIAKLKLPDREREELLQGLSERGPEAYREFIRDYYRRLAEIQQERQQ